MVRKQVLTHFRRKDPKIHSLIAGAGLEELRAARPADYFQKLCREIIGQQLSGRVAKVIFGRFTDLFPRGKVTPELTLKLPARRLRNAGMAWAKARAIRDLAAKVSNGTVNLHSLKEKGDDAAITELTKVKGIGPWTAHMFLMFSLGREDVFSHEDLGLRRAIRRTYGLRSEPTRKQTDLLAARWSPYRTYASLALWKSVDE